MRGSLRYALRASVEMTTLCKGPVGRRQEQKKKQIPFGNDRKKSKSNDKCKCNGKSQCRDLSATLRASVEMTT